MVIMQGINENDMYFNFICHGCNQEFMVFLNNDPIQILHNGLNCIECGTKIKIRLISNQINHVGYVPKIINKPKLKLKCA
jgi:rRNA maturation endonuclease Nob1